MKRLHWIALLSFTCALAIAATSWAADSTKTPATKAQSPELKTTTPATTKSLYERLGGEKAIAGVVSDFVDRAAKDPKLNFTRHGTPKEWKATPENVTALKHHVTQYLCMTTGGPQKYDGKDLKTVHQGMQITPAEFDAAAAHLSAALEKANVAKPEHEELMKIVVGTKDQIIEKTTADPAVKPTAAAATVKPNK